MAQGFDRLAGFYDEMMHIIFAGAIRQSQLCFLDKLSLAPEVLIIGGGTGWIVEKIWEYRPQARITYLELSPKMLSKTQNKIPREKQTQIQLKQGGVEAIPKLGQFDAVCTFFFIDLFSPSSAVLIRQKLLDSLKTSGHWLYADFEASTKHRFGWRKHLIHLMYQVCSCFCSLENTKYWDYKTTLDHSSLTLQESRLFFRGLIRAGLYQRK